MASLRDEFYPPCGGHSAFSQRWSMPKRTLAMVLAVLVSIGPACYSRKVQKVATVDVPQPKNERIVGITTLKGEDVSFDPPGASIKNGTLSASVRSFAGPSTTVLGGDKRTSKGANHRPGRGSDRWHGGAHRGRRGGPEAILPIRLLLGRYAICV